MADTCTLDRKATNATLNRKYTSETLSERFRVVLDSRTRDVVDVANRARAANPSQFPIKGQSWPARPSYGLFADSFQFEPENDLQSIWIVTVTYTPLQPNESNTEGTNENPLLWPAVYNLEWIEYEQAVTEARNVEAIGNASGDYHRPALTLGPVVNSALQEPDEGLFETYRDPVIAITKNVATLDQVIAVDTQYSRTTNSDTVYGVGPRRYRYLGVESGGVQTANGITYFPRIVRVAVTKTTERKINNVGWNNLDFDGKLVKVKVAPEDMPNAGPSEKVDPAEPVFLTLSGAISDVATSVTYRTLNEVPYASLLT